MLQGSDSRSSSLHSACSSRSIHHPQQPEPNGSAVRRASKNIAEVLQRAGFQPGSSFCESVQTGTPQHCDSRLRLVRARPSTINVILCFLQAFRNGQKKFPLPGAPNKFLDGSISPVHNVVYSTHPSEPLLALERREGSVAWHKLAVMGCAHPCCHGLCPFLLSWVVPILAVMGCAHPCVLLN